MVATNSSIFWKTSKHIEPLFPLPFWHNALFSSYVLTTEKEQQTECKKAKYPAHYMRVSLICFLFVLAASIQRKVCNSIDKVQCIVFFERNVKINTRCWDYHGNLLRRWLWFIRATRCISCGVVWHSLVVITKVHGAKRNGGHIQWNLGITNMGVTKVAIVKPRYNEHHCNEIHDITDLF